MIEGGGVLNMETLAFARWAEAVSTPSHAWLWPNTPASGNLQDKAIERTGFTDWQSDQPGSRSHTVLSAVKQLALPDGSWVMDIAAGDAVIATEVKRKYPSLNIVAFEPLHGSFETHAEAEAQGVRFVPGWLQNLVKHDVPESMRPISLVLMLNTYRSWEHAQLPESDRNLPRAMDKWLHHNAQWALVTVSRKKYWKMKLRKREVTAIGPGEDGSVMVLWRLARRA